MRRFASLFLTVAVLCLWRSAVLSQPKTPSPAYYDDAIIEYEALNYERAYELFTEARQHGAAPLRRFRDIVEYQAELAASLDRGQQAILHYRELLAIAPTYQPRTGTPRKFVQLFEEAREHNSRQSQTLVHVEVSEQTGQVIISCSNELGLLAKARLVIDGVAQAPDKDVTDRFVFQGSFSGSHNLHLLFFDSFSNEVFEKPLGTFQFENKMRAQVNSTSRPIATKPWYGRTSTWLATGAVLAGASGLYFGLRVKSDQSELDELRDMSGTVEWSEVKGRVESLQHRLDTGALITNIAWATSGALLLGAFGTYLWENRAAEEPPVTLHAGSLVDGAWVGMSTDF